MEYPLHSLIKQITANLNDAQLWKSSKATSCVTSYYT